MTSKKVNYPTKWADYQLHELDGIFALEADYKKGITDVDLEASIDAVAERDAVQEFLEQTGTTVKRLVMIEPPATLIFTEAAERYLGSEGTRNLAFITVASHSTRSATFVEQRVPPFGIKIQIFNNRMQAIEACLAAA